MLQVHSGGWTYERGKINRKKEKKNKITPVNNQRLGETTVKKKNKKEIAPRLSAKR